MSETDDVKGKIALNETGKLLMKTEQKAQYDANAKILLGDRQILAWILKYTVSEFERYDIPQIMACIGPTDISNIPVDPGLTNKPIQGESTESSIPYEGVVRYDVRFTARVPGTMDTAGINLIIDVEAQRRPNPGYDLVTRGFFYGGRMLSEQMGKVITGNKDYDKLQKVYSIWIVMNCSRESANTISLYKTVHEAVYGSINDTSRSDLIRVVMVRLPKEGDEHNAINSPSKIHELLSTVFSNEKSFDERRRILENNYNFTLTSSLKEVLKTMCNLSEAIEEKSIKKGSYNTLLILDRRQAFPDETAEDTAKAVGCNVDLVLSVMNYKRRAWKQ